VDDEGCAFLRQFGLGDFLQDKEPFFGLTTRDELKADLTPLKDQLKGEKSNPLSFLDTQFTFAMILPYYTCHGKMMGYFLKTSLRNTHFIGMSPQLFFVGHIPQYWLSRLCVMESIHDYLAVQANHMRYFDSPLPAIVPWKQGLSRHIFPLKNAAMPARMDIFSYSNLSMIALAEQCGCQTAIRMLSRNLPVSKCTEAGLCLATPIEDLTRKLEPLYPHLLRLSNRDCLSSFSVTNSVNLFFEDGKVFIGELNSRTPIMKGLITLGVSRFRAFFFIAHQGAIHRIVCHNRRLTLREVNKRLAPFGGKLLAYFEGKDILEELRKLTPAVRRLSYEAQKEGEGPVLAPPDPGRNDLPEENPPDPSGGHRGAPHCPDLRPRRVRGGGNRKQRKRKARKTNDGAK
jgi:hypothetical protein